MTHSNTGPASGSPRWRAGAVAAVLFAIGSAAFSRPAGAGATAIFGRGAPAGVVAGLMAARGPGPIPAAPAKPGPVAPDPAALHPVIVRVVAGRSAGTVAADAGAGADIGGRRRHALRPAIWRALIEAGTADLAPIEPLLASLSAAGHVRAVERFPIAHAVALRADAAGVTALRAAPGVIDVRPERVHRLAGTGGTDPLAALPPAPDVVGRLAAVGALPAWKRGIAGDGVVVAVFDAGVEWTHPVLIGRYRGRDGEHDYDWMDFVEATNRPIDGLGHGTGVAALAVGADRARAWGVAPAAEWMAVRAFDDQGSAGDGILLRSGEWLIAPTDLKLRFPRPDQAPDVINASWTLENGVDPLFTDLLAAWRALGITAVFAAGNDDGGIGASGTVLMPSAAADAISVGAVDDGGRIWRLSLGGPTWDDRIKPDVVAPGVEVLTASLDKGYDLKDGTSMAAPQVSGAAALLLSAQPDLSPDDIGRFLRQTAADAGQPGPDPVYGWGRLAADRAVDAAASAGRVAGRVSGPAGPLAMARVTLSAGDEAWTAWTDAEGRYGLSVPEGVWTVSVRAPGYGAAGTQAARVGVDDDTTTALDVALVAAPGRAVRGTVVDVWGAPVARARVEAVDPAIDPAAVALAPSRPAGAASVPPAPDAAVSAVTDAAGRFQLTAPSDAAVLRVRAAGHQAVTTTLAGAVALSLTLRAAPSILLVDADSWMGDGQRTWPYAARALADAGYALGDSVHVFTLSGPTSPLPSPPDVSPYGIVVWSHLYGSPGSLDRTRGGHTVTEWLTGWLAGGGRLLVTGQDIGQWDSAEGPASARLAPDFYRDILGARFLTTDAGAGTATGIGFLDGTALDIAWRRGLPKAGRQKPDAVAPAAGGAQAILRYRTGADAAIAVDGPPGRRAYLAFGPESAGDRAALGALYGRLIGWLTPPPLRVEATPARVLPGAAVRLTAAVAGGRYPLSATLRLDRPLWLQVADADVPSDWRRGEDGALIWTGTLGAAVPTRWTIPATVHPSAAGRQMVTLTLTAAGPPLTATTSVEVATPRLSRASTLAVVPARLVEPGPVRIVLRVANDGTMAAAEPFVRIGQLPVGVIPLTPTLSASSGSAQWLDDPHDGVRWSGTVPTGDAVTIAFDARVTAEAGVAAVLRATIDAGDDDRVVLSAGVRVGGPVVILGGPLRTAPPVLVAGRGAVLTVPLANAGREAALVVVRLVLPPGIEPPETPAGRWDAATRSLTLTVAIPAGAARPVDVPLRVDGDATPGARLIGLTIDDGLDPPAVLSTAFGTDIRRFDLRPSRLFISPDVVSSGVPASVTLFAGNFGDASVDVSAALALPPTLAANVRSVRTSGGRVRTDVANMEWDVRLSPAAEDYAATTEQRGPDWPPPPAGAPLGATDAAGRRSPTDLGIPVPFYAEIVTRTWVTDDGLIAFGPPLTRPDPVLGPASAGVPAIAALWRPGRVLGTPRIVRTADDWTVLWTADGGADAVAAASIDVDGRIRMWVAPDAPLDGAIVGLNAPDGRTLALAAAEVAGRAIQLAAPGGWSRLSFSAVPAASLAPNSRLQVKASLSTDGGPVVHLEGQALANRLSFDPTELTLSSDQPAPGAVLAAELNVATEGRIDARGAEVRIQLPAGVDIVPGSLSPELRQADGELVWQGRLVSGSYLALTWQMAVQPSVPPGTRLVVQARLRADGLPRTDRRAAATVRRSPVPTILKAASSSAARPGERVHWVLRALNPAAVPARLTLADALPAALTLEPDAAVASLGLAPTWDEGKRQLSWTGDVPAGAAVEVRFATRFAGQVGERVSNRLTVTSDDGIRLTTAADVFGAAGRCYLPAAWSGR